MKVVMKNTKENGLKIKCMVMEHIYIHPGQNIQENGKTINIVEKVYMNSLTEQYTRDNGMVIKCMDTGIILIKKVKNGKENL